MLVLQADSTAPVWGALEVILADRTVHGESLAGHVLGQCPVGEVVVGVGALVVEHRQLGGGMIAGSRRPIGAHGTKTVMTPRSIEKRSSESRAPAAIPCAARFAWISASAPRAIPCCADDGKRDGPKTAAPLPTDPFRPGERAGRAG
jgi:hypothetical protein